jgi:hypothetical protein
MANPEHSAKLKESVEAWNNGGLHITYGNLLIIDA